MRISTSMVYDAGVSSIQQRTSDLLHTQEQVSSGKRILTPADDPVAAARALEVSQIKSTNAGYLTNQNNASSSLGLVDTQLQSVSDILTRVRELTVQAGSAALNDADRASIAAELRTHFDGMMALANATDGAGRYMFSGYQGANKPFAGSVENGVVYNGDDGQRLLDISGSRQMPISESGNRIFSRITQGNGYFVTAAAVGGAGNQGTGVIDAGQVTDPAKWNGPGNPKQIDIRFWQDPATPGAALYYDLVDRGTGASLFSNTTSTAGGAGNTYTHAFVSGDGIALSGLAAPYGDLGAAVTITGIPRNGDAFNLNPSGKASVFDTLAGLVKALESPAGTPGSGNNAVLQNSLSSALTNLSQAEDNVLQVRADVGTRMSEVDAQQSITQNLDTQYAGALSTLQDVDYATAITDLTKRQTQLQAAQQSFVKVSNLSLFNYLS